MTSHNTRHRRFANQFTHRRNKRSNRTIRHRRLTCEPLEERTLLSIDMPGWMMNAEVDVAPAWNETDWLAGQEYTATIHHCGQGAPDPWNMTEFKTPSDWTFEVGDFEIFSLADKWTGFEVYSEFKMRDDLPSNATDYTLRVVPKVLDEPIAAREFTMGLSGDVAGFEGDLSFDEDLEFDGLDFTIWVDPPAWKAQLPFPEARIPVFAWAGVPQGVLDLVFTGGFDVQIGSAEPESPGGDDPKLLTLSFHAGTDGLSLDTFELHPALTIGIEVDGRGEALLGVATGGAKIRGELTQGLNGVYDFPTGSWSTLDAPGGIEVSATAYYSTLWGAGPDGSCDLFSWDVGSWDFLGNTGDPLEPSDVDSENFPSMTFNAAQVNPDFSTSAASYDFTVDFLNPFGDGVNEARLLVADVDSDGNIVSGTTTVYDMSLSSGSSGNGTYVRTVTGLSAGDHKYAFVFLDVEDRYFYSELFPRAGVDVVTVIDRSGSMGWEGKLVDAKNAATLFVGLMDINDKIGVVSYSSSASVDFPLTTISASSDVKSQAEAAIWLLTDDGMTSIGAGVRAANGQLVPFPDDPARAMIVMSDGQHNTDPDPIQVINSEVGTDIRIFTIGFGTDADVPRLTQMANLRNGEYREATPENLHWMYTELRAALPGMDQLLNTSGIMGPGETSSRNINVDPSAAQLTAGVNWGGSDFDLELIAPDGTRITHESAAADPDIVLVEEATYEFYKINAPLPGDWEMLVTAVDVPQEGEAYNLYAMIATDITAEVSTDKTSYQQGELVFIEVTVDEQIPVLGASVVAYVTPPANATFDSARLVLYDDGNHNDGAVDDGVYGNVFRRACWEGAYDIDVEVHAQSVSGFEFMRAPSTSFVVTLAPDTDGDGMPDPWEDREGTDKNVNDAGLDPDNDDLVHLDEYYQGTKPFVWDTDGDNFGDGFEVDNGTDPLDPDSAPLSEIQFDFGTPLSPVAAGYTQVTEATVYDPGLGYGWVDGTITSGDRTSGSDLMRDLNLTADATFLVDLPRMDGIYQVSLALGDRAMVWHDRMAVSLEGTRVDVVSTVAEQVKCLTYAVHVTDGQLTLRLEDLGGTVPDVAIEMLRIVQNDDAPVVHIIDDNDPGFSVTRVDDWDYYSGYNSPMFDIGYLHDLHASRPGDGSDVARWEFAVTPGTYEVAATWFADPDGAINAPFTIFDGQTELSVVRIDQQVTPDDFTGRQTAWDVIDTVTVAGDTLVVELSDDADGWVIADAVRIQTPAGLRFDFGDAPDTPYPTVLAWDGARHTIVPGFHLGALIDAETDGLPFAAATGDDSINLPDEDGVTFTSPLVPGCAAAVTVNASAAGLLDAWVDFNADGDWLDAGEQVFASQPLAAGDNHLTFAVPGGSMVGEETFARFRFSSAGGLEPTGPATDGEVEDHAVEIVEPPNVAAAVLPDPLRLGELALFVWGSTGDDTIYVNRRSNGKVAVTIVETGYSQVFAPTENGHIYVFADGAGAATLGGDDVVTMRSSVLRDAIIHGGPGNDTLTGGQGNDLLDGGTGGDTLRGKDGDDDLSGGPGYDYLDGGSGNDRLEGGAGRDRIFGRGGDDLLFGGAGNDKLVGGAGHDALVGGEGNDELLGRGGNDLLIGSAGFDLIHGHSGQDILVAGSTDHDTNDTALLAILAEWTRVGGIDARINNLENGGGLNGSYILELNNTVHDDGDVDDLYGEAGNDWFLFYALDVAHDHILGKTDRSWGVRHATVCHHGQ